MKVIDKIHFLIASICLLHTTGISSQNMTTSPYSMFGIGELTDGIIRSACRHGRRVSVGMRDPILINSVNPAGLTGLDSLRLVADATAFVKNEWVQFQRNPYECHFRQSSSFHGRTDYATLVYVGGVYPTVR